MSGRALIIQDHDGVARALRLLFEKLAFDVVETDLGEEGLDFARMERFDIYVVDDCLPDLSGYEILRVIRTLDQQAPAVFVSSAAHDPDIAGSAYASGADLLLQVPFNLKHGVKSIEALLVEMRGFGPLRRAWERD